MSERDYPPIPLPVRLRQRQALHRTCPTGEGVGAVRKFGGRLLRAYVRKYRLWCTDKGDHCGILSTFEGKERMEFYPDDLPVETLDARWRRDMVEF